MRRTIWWKIIFWKTLPQFCLRLWAKRFRQRNFSKLSKLNSTCSDEIFDEKTFFRKKFYSFFLLCSKTFLTSYNFFQSWQNCFSSGQTDTLVKKILFEKRFLKILSDFGRNNSQLSIQFLQRYCQNRFLHDKETFQGNRLSHFFFNTFSDFGQKFSQVSHKFFRKVVKTAFYVFRRTFWWKKKTSENSFFFAILVKLFLSFDKI